jgi:hypothetical protein
MTSEHTAANIESWKDVTESIETFPDSTSLEWKNLARRFVEYGLERKFNRYFRAGLSVTTIVFSTLERHGLRYEARVLVTLRPPNKLKLDYSPGIPAIKGDQSLDYELNWDDALPTFQRFLNHLWEMTMSEPLPLDMRSSLEPFNAPVLTEFEKESRS